MDRSARPVEVEFVAWLAAVASSPDEQRFWTLDLPLFASVFAITFVAELPDKTAFAALILATKANPWAIFVGGAAAFVLQTIIAVTCGSVVGLLPPPVIRIGSGILFIVLAGFMWFRREPEEEELDLEKVRGRFLRTIWVSFVVIFIAEWGDLTQFSTALLAAKHGHGKVLTVSLAAILALWAVTALAIAIGHRAKRVLHPTVLKKIAAVAFAGVGILLLSGIRWPGS
jgi:putative Ca2+/H+ antiporter (TMEM165/GDT1 family)